MTGIPGGLTSPALALAVDVLQRLEAHRTRSKATSDLLADSRRVIIALRDELVQAKQWIAASSQRADDQGSGS